MNNDILPLFCKAPASRPLNTAVLGWVLAAFSSFTVHAQEDRSNWVQFPPKQSSKPVQADRDSVAPKATAEAAPQPAPPAAAKPAPEPAPVAKPTPAPAKAEAVGIQLVGFEFSGNQAISSADLTKALSSMLGMKSNMAEFEKITDEVTRIYRQKGLLARADLPQQELSNGVLRVNVTEAKFGGAVLDDPSGAMKASRHLVKIIERQQPVGQTINLNAMETASLLAAEVPGVKTQISLQPGQNAGESVALVQVARSKEKEAQVDLDNHGSRAVGLFRQSLNFNLNNPRNRGDKLGVNLLNSEGVKYGKLMYSIPVGDQGWRVAAYASAMHYKLITDNFAALQAEGPSSTLGLELNMPLIRTGGESINFNVAGDLKQYRNDANGQMQSRYSGQSTTFSLDASGQDPLSPWSYRSSAAWALGYLDLSNSTADHIGRDQAGPQTAGYYQRLRLSHFQRYALDDRRAVMGQIQTQWASKNLDGAEKFYLGGAQGVRAYPANEAGGSQASLLTMEYQHQLPLGINTMTVAGFYDWGDVLINKFNAYSSPNTLNYYQLQGAGLWIGSSLNSNLGHTDFKLTWARRIGNNPNAGTNGQDQDGSLVLNRYLFNINHVF